MRSIDAIAEVDKNVAPSVNYTSPTIKPTPVPKGAYAPDIIVLLTDGASNWGPTPLEAAQQAADRGIRVYTIGFGTARGSDFPNCDRQFISRDTVGGDPRFGGGGQGFGGGGFRRGVDEDTLKAMAAKTDATYYTAESAGELQDVFKNLPKYLIMKHEVTEISVVFTAFGALLATTAIGLSLSWHPLG